MKKLNLQKIISLGKRNFTPHPEAMQGMRWGFTRKLKNAFFIQTRFASDGINKNYVLISSGGREGKELSDRFIKPLPEEADYQSTLMVYKTLLAENVVEPKNIRVLFGKNTQKKQENNYDIVETRLTRSFSKLLFLKLFNFIDHGLIITHEAKVSVPINGENNYNNIKTELGGLLQEAKKGDNVFIFLMGHGSKFQGLILWNERRTVNFLTKDLLQKIFTENPTEAKIFLIVESCYSGVYLTLSNKNIVVLSSATMMKPSLYMEGQSSRYLHLLMNYFTKKDSSNLLFSHAQGALASESFYPADSLSHFINNKIYGEFYPIFYKFWKVYHETLTVLRSQYLVRSFIIPSGSITVPITIIFISFISIQYPDMGADTLLSIIRLKSLASCIPIALPVLKICLAITSVRLYSYLENCYTNSEFYKKRPVMLDTLLMHFLEKKLPFTIAGLSNAALSKDTIAYLSVRKEKLFFILEKLNEMAFKEEFKKPVYSHYIFLLDKLCIYLLWVIVNNQSNQRDELDYIIETAYRLLSPLSQNENLKNKNPMLKRDPNFSGINSRHVHNNPLVEMTEKLLRCTPKQSHGTLNLSHHKSKSVYVFYKLTKDFRENIQPETPELPKIKGSSGHCK